MLTWNVDPVFLTLGHLQIRYYGLCFLITILGGFWLWRWQIIRAGRIADAARRFLLLGLLVLLFSGRFLIEHSKEYHQ